MIKTTIGIDGMMCGMCESHINDVIRREFKVKKVSSAHTKGIAEIISEKFNIPLADLVDVFAEIPTANNDDCTRTPKERGGEK